jgi:hypothetical protein
MHPPVNGESERGLKPELLMFLYDKRLTLFNARRDIEWKVFLSVVAALGLMDATILDSQRDIGGNYFKWAVWAAICLAVVGLPALLLRDLQSRNRRDRAAMNVLNNQLCGLLKLASNDLEAIRERDEPNPGRVVLGLQLPFLVIAGVLSAALPGLVR